MLVQRLPFQFERRRVLTVTGYVELARLYMPANRSFAHAERAPYCARPGQVAGHLGAAGEQRVNAVNDIGDRHDDNRVHAEIGGLRVHH